MKQIKKHQGKYLTPESVLLEARFEGTLCASTFTPSEDKQLEGFGGENEFTGWGN